jgi:hypothetical protein
LVLKTKTKVPHLITQKKMGLFPAYPYVEHVGEITALFVPVPDRISFYNFICAEALARGRVAEDAEGRKKKGRARIGLVKIVLSRDFFSAISAPLFFLCADEIFKIGYKQRM